MKKDKQDFWYIIEQNYKSLEKHPKIKKRPLSRKELKILIKDIAIKMPLNAIEKKKIFKQLLKKHRYPWTDYRNRGLCLIEFYIRCQDFTDRESIYSTINLASIFRDPMRTFPDIYNGYNGMMKPISLDTLENFKHNYSILKEYLYGVGYYDYWFELFHCKLPSHFNGNLKDAVELLSKDINYTTLSKSLNNKKH